MSRTRTAVAVVLSVALAVPAQAACNVARAFTRADEGGTRTVTVFEGERSAALNGNRPLFFVVPSMKVNTDGTSRSYHRDDPRARTLAINDMRNAMHRGRTIADFEAVAAAGWPLPRTWSVLLPNVIEADKATGKPCVDAKGFLVSMTSDVAVAGGFARAGDCDQSKWLDALEIPALVLPGGATQFRAREAGTRTPVVAMALGGARSTAHGIVGDHGPANELGEASVEMNRMLQGLPAGTVPANHRDAVVRFQGPRSIVMVMPGNSLRLARPIDAASTEARVKARFEAWGGTAKLAECAAAMGG